MGAYSLIKRWLAWGLIVLVAAILAGCAAPASTALIPSPSVTVLPTLTATSPAAKTPTAPLPTLTPSVLSTPSPTPTFVYPPNGTPFPEWSSEEQDPDWGNEISPDRQWKISVNNQHPVIVASYSSDQKTFQESTSGSLGQCARFESWFPDNTGFILNDGNKNCDEVVDRLIVYHINEKDNLLDRYVFTPHGERSKPFFSRVVWSPDGTRFAVVIDRREIVILDRKARLLHSYTPIPKNNLTQISRIYWTSRGLFYKINDAQPYPLETNEIRLVDPDHMGAPETTLFASKGYPDIISFDPFSSRFLVHRKSDLDKSDDQVELAVFNIKTRQFEKTIYISNNTIGYLSSSDSAVIAIQDDINIGKDNLFLFYWKNLSLADKHKQIWQVWNWDADLRAFIVVMCDESGAFAWKEVVRP
jgi:hypothetical protein